MFFAGYVNLSEPKLDETESIEVSRYMHMDNYLHDNAVVIDIREDIAVFLECADELCFLGMRARLKNNHRHILCVAKYNLKDGSEKTVTYLEPHGMCDYPLKDFFDLESVVKQRNSLFSINEELVGKAFFSYNYGETVVGAVYNKAVIKDIIEFGREDAFGYKNKAAEFEVQLYSADDVTDVICLIPIYDDATGIAELCEKYPQIEAACRMAEMPETIPPARDPQVIDYIWERLPKHEKLEEYLSAKEYYNDEREIYAPDIRSEVKVEDHYITLSDKGVFCMTTVTCHYIIKEKNTEIKISVEYIDDSQRALIEKAGLAGAVLQTGAGVYLYEANQFYDNIEKLKEVELTLADRNVTALMTADFYQQAADKSVCAMFVYDDVLIWIDGTWDIITPDFFADFRLENGRG